MGEFVMKNFTSRLEDKDGVPIFLKTRGDNTELFFILEQNINKLNGNEKVFVAEDKKGYDKQFGIDKINFGKGCMIIRHTDYQNKKSDPQIYTNYLKANCKKDADTKVTVCEEGDYEVVLDYKLGKYFKKIKGKKIWKDYYDYKMCLKFKVRNGNCKVFPMDLKSGSELKTRSVTRSGFKLDLTKSRYLDINVKREVIDKKGNIEEKFNKVANESKKYDKPGRYTITVSNRYTHENSKVIIYVGDKSVKNQFEENL